MSLAAAVVHCTEWSRKSTLENNRFFCCRIFCESPCTGKIILL